MDTNNKKILTMSYLIGAALLAYSIRLLMEAIGSIVPGLTAITSIEFVQHGLPVVVGLGTFMILQFNKRINEYADEVVTEIKKVVWPSRRDTTAMTIVVCVLVVFAGFMLSAFDGLAGYVVGQLTKLPLP